jgi:hypothetical protein
MLKINLFAALMTIAAISCAKSSDSSTTAATGTTTTQTCRTYPTNVTDTGSGITYACTFNGSTTLTCTNGGAETITYTYGNLQNFVNEAASPVSAFNKISGSSLVIASATVAQAYNITYTYNGSGQLTNSTVVNNGVTTSFTYTAWDSSSRATASTAQFTAGAACTGRGFTIAYVDATTRTKTTTNTAAGTGANCGSLNVPVSQTDANGNPIVGLGRNYTINSTASQCY